MGDVSFFFRCLVYWLVLHFVRPSLSCCKPVWPFGSRSCLRLSSLGRYVYLSLYRMSSLFRRSWIGSMLVSRGVGIQLMLFCIRGLLSISVSLVVLFPVLIGWFSRCRATSMVRRIPDDCVRTLDTSSAGSLAVVPTPFLQDTL